ncbi:MAG: hypothetical protein DKM50_09380 [Candidatus Margulisiibacteriota bacterium]|nr:MAG: hypothetical protein A2X43_02270 [Candidatus Margulisbacteria bacterium GWD2_39_127]OGI00900.1 MAG: hypothetical protein A2X42_03145 [Candidatus Margulisbacteria bacterium GWF2_38_17]OGI08755.1 MAG: hypothetical protein A2X41_05400 [Candidatus Margulisbacteria bacterium GWE2_39_32]PZM79466.1 MAG: hypothetical protein DKM50_09380 [Candidatus Margulisiibacteriota bacterium]HAR63480.1 hypothetical protein [Candidatus Margulisiibacteriota bacterium]
MNCFEKILIVDDEKHIRDVLSLYLKREGYCILSAENGKEGLEITRRERPSIIISDSMMPVMDGLEFCMQVKKDSELKDTIFIMLTGKNTTDDSIEGLDIGVDEYLTKPFNNKEIVARVNAFSRICKLTRELKEKNQKLEQLDKLKNDLTHMIIHDMKTPISGIMLTIDILLDISFTSNLDADQKKFLMNCRLNVKELLNMVMNLLDITKMEEGKMELDLEQFDSRQLVEELMTELNHLFEERKLKVVLDFPSEGMETFADISIIKRVMMNLLTNAIKHTPRAGTITVLFSRTEDAVSIGVRDTGEGIPEEFQKTIFEKFSKLTTKMTQKYDTGLGLTFCKLAMEAHRGTIGLVSELSKGSTFTITLPLASAEKI